MSKRVWVSQDAYRAGERFMLIAEHKEFLVPRSFPPCIYSTGYTGSPWFMNRSDVMDFSISQLLPKTHSVLSIDSGGTATFANDTAIQAIDQAVAWSEAQGRTGPFLFAGTSMGAMDTLAWIRTHQNKVAGFIGFCPGVNLSGGVAEDRQGIAAAAHAAYGGAYNPAVHGPTHDPTMYAAELVDVPILLLYSSNDTLTTPADMAAFDAAAPDCRLVNCGAVGDHNKAAVTAACARPEIAAFLAEIY